MVSIKELGERGAGAARSAGSTLGRLAGRAAAAGYGRVAEMRRGAKTGMDDKTLARKVETEIFRGADAPKSSVNVNVVDGVVELRGEVKRPEDVKELEAKTRAVPEVRDVKNLLHLRKTPSPTRTDTPPRQRRTAEGRQTKQRKRVEKTAERREVAEPTPRQVAAEGSGRKPAPLGSKAPGGGKAGGREGAETVEKAEPERGGATTGGRGSTGGATTGAAKRAKTSRGSS